MKMLLYDDQGELYLSSKHFRRFVYQGRSNSVILKRIKKVENILLMLEAERTRLENQ